MNSIALDSERPHHLRIMHDLQNQLRAIFDGSSEGVFIYLDREHKTCSEKLAAIFGYSQLQWEEIYPFEGLFSEASKDDVMATYYEKIIAEKAPALVSFTGVRRDGALFAARLIMVPITYEGLLFALCFVKPEVT